MVISQYFQPIHMRILLLRYRDTPLSDFLWCFLVNCCLLSREFTHSRQQVQSAVQQAHDSSLIRAAHPEQDHEAHELGIFSFTGRVQIYSSSGVRSVAAIVPKCARPFLWVFFQQNTSA